MLQRAVDDEAAETVADEMHAFGAQPARVLRQPRGNVRHGTGDAPVVKCMRLQPGIVRKPPSQHQAIGPVHPQAVDVNDVFDGLSRTRAPVPDPSSVAVLSFGPPRSTAGEPEEPGTPPNRRH